MRESNKGRPSTHPGLLRTHLHRPSRSPLTLQKIVPKRSRARPLNFKELGNHTRPPFNSTGATLLNILGVVGRNDFLARLGVVHDGFGVREESIEAPVEDAGSDEGVDVADIETAQVELLAWLRPSCARRWLAASSLRASCFREEGKGRGLQVLTARRDAGFAHARYNNVVDEAGERGDAADEEGGDGAPVASVSGRVAVDAVEVIHVRYGHVAAPDNVVAVARDKRISGCRRGRWGPVWDCGGRTRS